MKKTIANCETKMKIITENSLSTLLEKQTISENAKTTLKEILKSSKTKDPKGNRCSDNWVVLCLLLHMRSPVTYRMMRDLEILPLPTERTIRKYLAKIDCPCGFDDKFYEILKEHFSTKSGKGLHGVLLLDEMSTRKGLLLDNKNMKLKGVEDFGDTFQKDDNLKLADHGLVLVFQSLYEDISQPVAVFASSGPTKGDDLAKIVVQAIILLENAGAKMHGIISDGGAPNLKMWTVLGCSGKLKNLKNFFEHSLEENRKIFLFWDTPYLIKCVRNRLANSEELKIDPNEEPIKWEYFKILYELDKLQPDSLRICPKISENHVNIARKTMLKMRVSYAVQIFSNTVAKGLRWYKTYDKRLDGVKNTAQFCEKINNVFDALNRTWKNSKIGLTDNCKDMQVLEDFLACLNAWEGKVVDGFLKATDFLTPQTLEVHEGTFFPNDKSTFSKKDM